MMKYILFHIWTLTLVLAAPDVSHLFDNSQGYIYNAPSNTINTQDFPQKFDEANGYDYTRPKVPFEPNRSPDANNFVSSFVKPVTTTPAYSSTFQSFDKDLGYAYTKPSIPFNFDSNNQVNTFIRPTSTRATTTRPKPSTETGYQYPRPSVPFEFIQPTSRPTTTKRPVYNQPQRFPEPNNNVEVFLRPSTPASTAAPSTTLQPFNKEQGYSYSRPSIPFNFDSNNQVNLFVRPSTQRPTVASTVQFLNPDTGYNYPRPSVPVQPVRPQPSTTRRPTTRPTTKQSLYNQPQRLPDAANSVPSYVRPISTTTGYDYPKPAVSFGFDSNNQVNVFVQPSTQRPTRPSTTPRPAPYPTQIFNKDTGYDYSKPSVPFQSNRPQQTVATTKFTTTATKRPVYNQPQRLPESNNEVPTFARPSSTRAPYATTLQFFNSETGYDYSKPSVPFQPSRPQQTVATTKFTTIATRRPVYNQPQRLPESNNEVPVFARPSSTRAPYTTTLQPFNPETGYDYSRPSVPFQSNRPQQTVATTKYTTTATRRPVFNQPQRLPESNNEIPTFARPSSTRAPFTTTLQSFNTETGYDYSRPSVLFQSNRPQQTVATTKFTTTATRRPIYNQPQRLPESNNAVPVFARPSSTRAPFTTALQFFNSETGYNYSKPSVPFQPSRPQQTVATTKFTTTATRRPVYNQPQRLPESNNEVPVFARPSSTRAPYTTTLQPFNPETGYDYSRPSVPFQPSRPQQTVATTKFTSTATRRPVYNQPQRLPESNNEVPTFARPSSTRAPYTTTVQPFSSETGYDYSKPSVPFGTRPTVQEASYQEMVYPAASFDSQKIVTRPTTTRRPVYNQPQRLPEQSIRPVARPSTSRPTTLQPLNKETGYDYPKPVVIFEQQRPLTTRSPQTTRPVYNQPQRVEPVTSRPILPSSDSDTGYSYPKAPGSFSFGSNNQFNTFVRPSSTPRPFVSSTVQSFSSETGYGYERPAIPFSYESNNQVNNFVRPNQYSQPQKLVVSTQRPLTTLKFSQESGYQYRKPAASEISQNTADGYEYRRPDVDFLF